jgi:hypothetical protein
MICSRCSFRKRMLLAPWRSDFNATCDPLKSGSVEYSFLAFSVRIIHVSISCTEHADQDDTKLLSKLIKGLRSFHV